MRANEAGDLASLQDMADIISNFERQCLGISYTLQKIVVSTWTADSHPYNPSTFANFDYNLQGEYYWGVTPGDYIPANLRLSAYVHRSVNSGRYGKLTLRGFLDTRDIVNSYDSYALSTSGYAQTKFESAVVAMNDKCGTGSELGFVLAAIPKGTTTVEVRDLTAFNLQDSVLDIPINHKFYNRLP
jgi:hypothetical protein